VTGTYKHKNEPQDSVWDRGHLLTINFSVMDLLHEVIKQIKRYPYEAAFGGMDIKV
jgi:hypothetical protein